jgi:hypothetical protein
MGGPRLKQNEVFVALTATTGNIAAAARRLGATRDGLWKFVERHPRLLQLTKDFRESIVDNAESAFNRAVVTEQPWAIQFALRTIGRRRGYVDRQEIQHVEPIQIEIAEEIVDAPQTPDRAAAPYTG